jgi:UDP-sugar transporter A1/2/3
VNGKPVKQSMSAATSPISAVTAASTTSSSSSLSWRGFTALVLLAVQFAVQPMLIQKCITPGTIKTSIVFATELTKAVLASSAIVLLHSKDIPDIAKSFTLKWSLCVAGGPAVFYSIQNWLVQLSYQNLDSLTFNLLNQTKVRRSLVLSIVRC